MSSPRFAVLLAQVLAAALALFASFAPQAAAPAQKAFATPNAAAQALYEAVRAGDRAGISAVLGPGSADVIDSGDGAEDMAGRARFVAAYKEASRIETKGARRAELVIGPQEWRFPFPLLRDARGWRFDAASGRNEVIARRIGRNELAAMQAVLGYVDAQREYALQAHDGAGPGIYAQRIASATGRHDGLYWTPSRGEPLSPLGVMFTLAAAEEAAGGEARPYHGYFFRVLRAQGAHARGGASDYVVKGRMIGGFALIAYPARYRVSGVKSFIVNHEGEVYSADLGTRTAALARSIRLFDPDRAWRRETEAVARSEEGERTRRLAGDYGCTVCHRDRPAPLEADAPLPLAPSWADIATRYAGRKDAEEQLTHTVIDGADPAERHWRIRADFTAMGANAQRVSPDEARALVRWILSTP